MKKIFVFFAAALLLFACKAEDPVLDDTSADVTVLKSDVLFDALGGTGSITVEDLSGGRLTAFSSSDW